MKTTEKRFLIFCLIVFVLALTPMSKPVFVTNKTDDVSYFFYATDIGANLSAEVTNCGNAYIIQCDAENAMNVKNEIGGIQGESVRIKNYSTQTYTEILQKYNDLLVGTERVDDTFIMLCYDKTLPKFVEVEGCKVNIQIAILKSEINIGYPLILNGY